jgi:hypothetical protein
VRVIHRSGKSGRLAAQQLGKRLDDRFTLIHRVRLPNLKDIVDAVLVGPQGVTVLAIADDTGRVRCLGDNWYAWQPERDKFLSTRHNPARQAQQHRQAIEMFVAGRQMGSMIPVDAGVLVPQTKQVEFMQTAMPIVAADKIVQMGATLAAQRELIEWTQADDVLKALGVTPLGKPWSALRQVSRKRAARGIRFAGLTLPRNQWILLAVIAVANILLIVGGLLVVLRMP